MNLSPSRSAYVGLAALLALGFVARGSGNDRALLLSIYTDNVGVVSPIGRHLYASINTSGEMTYADRTKAGIVNCKRILTASQLSRLNSVLHDARLSEIQGRKVDHTRSHLDYMINVEVVIARSSGRQEFTLVDYDPAAGRDFPEGARELLCMIDAFRRSSYRLTQNCK